MVLLLLQPAQIQYLALSLLMEAVEAHKIAPALQPRQADRVVEDVGLTQTKQAGLAIRQTHPHRKAIMVGMEITPQVPAVEARERQALQ